MLLRSNVETAGPLRSAHLRLHGDRVKVKLRG